MTCIPLIPSACPRRQWVVDEGAPAVHRHDQALLAQDLHRLAHGVVGHPVLGGHAESPVPRSVAAGTGSWVGRGQYPAACMMRRKALVLPRVFEVVLM